VVRLLGLVGTPPTAVFLGKLQLFTTAINGGWLAGLAVVNTIASLFYYLRWLIAAVLQRPAESTVGAALEPAGRLAAVAAYAAGTTSLAVGIAGAAALPLLAGHLTR
jgi:NADH-quinone oxidoreductase subunit N